VIDEPKPVSNPLPLTWTKYWNDSLT
jgi:hypothetical protein